MGKRNNMKPKPLDFSGPRTAMAPYFAFCNVHRNEVLEPLKEEALKNDTPLDITESGRRLKDMWEKTSNEEKEKLKEQWKADKAEYNVKLNDWKQTEDYKNFLEAKRVYEGKNAALKAKKAVNDAGAPKKAPNAYFLFSSKKREAVVAKLNAEGQKLDFKAIAMIVSTAWKELPAEEKKPYEEEAAKLKAEFDLKHEEFKTTDAYKEFRKTVEKNSEKSARSKKEINQVGKEPVLKKERKHRAPKLDAEGNEIPMKTRARKPKKELASTDVASTDVASTEVAMAEPAADAPAPTEVPAVQ